MFSLEDDDDFGVSSAGSSNLASLFTSDTITPKDGNQSLMYNAPKQPKKSTKSSSASTGQSSGRPQMDIIHATVVPTFMYDGSKHVPQGKLGMALIGNHSVLQYRILLYKSQQQHVSFSTISLSFQFIIQANNYATFYDDNKQNWSVNFESEQAMIEFAKQVCIAKANLNKTVENIIVQDLVIGEGEALDSRDTVEIKYTGWFLTNNKFGEMFDSNSSSEKPLRLRIHHGKCIKGIENGLVGMKKFGKRLVIVPPPLGYANIPESESALKTNILIYELEIKRCKFSKDSSSSRSSTPIISDTDSDKRTEGMSASRSQSASDDVSIRARGASLSEQLSQSPSKKKATIISRIVKMGQPMLPLQGAIAVQPSSESENEEEILTVTGSHPPATIEPETKPIPKPRPQQMAQAHAAPLSHPSILPTQAPAQSVSMFQPSSLVPAQTHSFPISAASPFPVLPQSQYAPPVASPLVVGGGDAHVQLLMTENRTQNMEMRMLMNKISDKIDTVLSKIDHSAPHSNNQMAMSSLDIASLSYNIQRIFQENETLRKENVEKSEKIEIQNEKICSLLQKNQKYMEQSTDLLEQRSSSLNTTTVQLQMQVEKLEQEKIKLSKEYSGFVSQQQSLQQECQNLRDTIQSLNLEKDKILEQHRKLKEEHTESTELTKKLEAELQKVMQSHVEKENEHQKAHSSDLEELQSRCEELTNQNEALSAEIIEMKQKHEDNITLLTDQIKQLKRVKSSPKSSSDIVDEVKKIMNIVYKHLQGEFEQEENYSGSYIAKMLMRSIRQVTLQLMEKYSQEAKDGKEQEPKSDDSVGIQETPVPQRETTGAAEEDSTLESKEVNLYPLNHKKNAALEHFTNDDSQKENVTEETVQKSLEEKLGDDTRSNDSSSESWRPQPPPPPSFIEDDDDDDWLK